MVHAPLLAEDVLDGDEHVSADAGSATSSDSPRKTIDAELDRLAAAPTPAFLREVLAEWPQLDIAGRR